MALSPRIRTLRSTIDLSGGAGTIREFPVGSLNGNTPLWRAVNLRIARVSGSTANVATTLWDLRTASGGLGLKLANGNIAVNNVGANIASFPVSQAQSGVPVMGTGWLQSSPSLFWRLTGAPALDLVVVIEIDVIDYGQVAAPTISDNAFAGLNNCVTTTINCTRSQIVGNFLYILAPGLVTREGVTKNNIAVYDLTTGLATAFNFTVAGGVVQAFVVDTSNGDVYIGGTFTSVNGTGRNKAACVDSTGTLKAWNPNLSGAIGGSVTTQITRMLMVGSVVYFIGNFTTLAGPVTRNMAAAVDTSGTVQAWNPNVTPSGALNMVLTAMCAYGSDILIGGNITAVGGTGRNAVASVTNSTGALNAWAPSIGTVVGGTTVTDIATDGTSVWLSGTLTTGPARPGLAKFDAAGALVTAFAPGGMSNPNPPDAIAAVDSYVIFGTSNNPSPTSKILDKVTGADTGASLYQPGLRSSTIAVSSALGFLFVGNGATAGQVTALRYKP